MKSNAFDGVLSHEESIGWDCVKAVIENFLGKYRSENYRILMADMMDSFENLNVHMSLKIHLLHHHLDYFENQLASESDEHGERFHQIAMPMEVRYKRKKLDSLVSDICWWSQKKFKLSTIMDVDHEDEGTNIEEIDFIFTDSSDDEETEAVQPSKRRKTIGQFS